MPIKSGNNTFFAIIASCMVFFVLYASLSTRVMLILMNGLFVGAMVGVFLSFGQLLWDVALQNHHHDRARHMMLAMATHWIATSLLIAASIMLVSADRDQSTFLGLAGRHFAIIAAALTVTAPDLDLGLCQSRNWKLLTASLVVGGVAAVLASAIPKTD